MRKGSAGFPLQLVVAALVSLMSAAVLLCALGAGDLPVPPSMSGTLAGDLGALLMALGPASAFAQHGPRGELSGQAATGQVPPQTASSEEAFDVSADRLVGSRQGEADVVTLTGHVRIIHGTTTATADSGLYDRQIDMIRLTGNVTLKERDIEVKGCRGEYLKRERKIVFPSGVEMLEAGTRLSADRGVYDIGADSLSVQGNVAYVDSLKSMRAASASYLRQTERLAAWGDVVIRDEGYGAFVTAGEVTYLRPKAYGTARSKPVLEILARPDREAMTVSADSMELYADEKRALAVGDVKIARQKADGRCGRAEFLDLEDKSVLSDNPVMRQGESSISGDSMTIFSKDDQISEVLVTGNAKCVYSPQEGEGSELTATDITIHFAQGEIAEMHLLGGATGVFLPSDEGARATRNEVSGSTMVLGFEEGKVKTATVVGQVRGHYTIEGDSTRGPKAGAVGVESGEKSTGEPAGDPAPTGSGSPGGGGDEGEGPGADSGGPEPRDSTRASVPAHPASSETPGPEEVVAYEADSLHYDVPEALMYLTGGAKIVYGGMRLEARQIEYDSRTDNLYATVEPVLYEGEDKITGTSLSYNLKTKRGAISAGRTRFEKGIYIGRLIRKTGANTLNVEGGAYTSCDYLDAHYTFTSSRMKITLDDKVIASPVVLRLRGMPVLALPFYMFPIKRGRHSGILVPKIELGFDEAKGRFIRNAGYYWAPSDYYDVTAWGDYYEKSKWVARLEGNYSVRYLLSGSFDGSYTKDVVTHNSRWDIGGRHTQTVGDNGKLVTHADFVSDKTYRKDTSDDLEKALRRVLESDVSYSGTWGGKSFNISAQRTENLDTDEISEKLPAVSILLTRKTLFAPGEGEGAWHKGTYFSANSSFAGTLNKKAGLKKTRQAGTANLSLDSDLALAGGSQSIRSRLVLTGDRKDMSEWCPKCTGGKRTNSAGDLRTDFVTKLKALGWLNFSPSATAAVTLYDEDKAGKRGATRFMYWGGLDTRATLYRTYFPRIGPLAALRHVVSPSVTFTYRPDFSKYKNRFWSLSGVSSEVGKSSVASLALSNRLQAKIGSGENTRKIDDLMSLSTSTTYDFLYKDSKKKTPFSTIQSNLRLYPTEYTTFDLDFSNEPIHLSLKSLDFQAGFNFTGKNPLPPGLPEPELVEEAKAPEQGVGGQDAAPTGSPWRLDLAYRYTKGFDGREDTYWLEVLTGFNLTRNWRIEYSGRFDLSGHETVYQEYSIYRDLHCWEARFVRRYSDSDWEYYLRVNIKAHPEIYAERGLRALYRAY